MFSCQISEAASELPEGGMGEEPVGEAVEEGALLADPALEDSVLVPFLFQ